MTDEDATDTTSAAPETEGTPETGSPETQAPDSAELIASARKRQAGAEAARQLAESKLKEALAELGTYKAKDQTAAEKDLGELATLKANLAAAEKRAAEAEANAEKKILDARFPNARKELPEVTDEVRLAKFEAMLKDDEDEGPPTPRGNNPNRTAGSGAEPAKPLTSEDIIAKMRLMKDYSL
jgi:hypothetical protein